MAVLRQIAVGYASWLWYHLCKPYRDRRKEQAKARMKICESCEHFWRYTRQCSLCWCFMHIKVKMHFDLDNNGKSIGGCLEHRW